MLANVSVIQAGNTDYVGYWATETKAEMRVLDLNRRTCWKQCSLSLKESIWDLAALISPSHQKRESEPWRISLVGGRAVQLCSFLV